MPWIWIAVAVAVAALAAGGRLAYRQTGGLPMPGRAPPRQDSMGALEPAFRRDLEAVLARLRARGHRPLVWETVRTQERQAYLASTLPGTPATLGAHGRGEAADIIDGRPHPTRPGVVNGWGSWPGDDPGDELANARARAFFRALGEEAENQGLVWGGRWTGRYGPLGDSPHVEARTA